MNEPSTFIQWMCSYFLSSWDLNCYQGHSWGPSGASLTILCKAANWSYRLGLTFTWKLWALRIKARFFLSPLRSSVASLTRCPVHHTSLSSQSSGPMGLFSAHVLLLPALDLRYPAPHPLPQITLFHPSELRLKSLAFSWPQKRLIPTLCYPPISCAIFLCSIYHITTVINFIIDASVSTSPNQMYVLGRHVELCHEHRRYAVNTVQTNEFRSINMDNIYNI